MPILSKPKPLYHGGPTREQLTEQGSPWRVPAELVDDYCALAADPGAYRREWGEVNLASADAKLMTGDADRAAAWEATGHPLPRRDDRGTWPAGVDPDTFRLHSRFLMAADRVATARRSAAEQAERHRRAHTCAGCGTVHSGAVRACRLPSRPDTAPAVLLCQGCAAAAEAAYASKRAAEKVGGRTRAALVAAVVDELIRADDRAAGL